MIASFKADNVRQGLDDIFMKYKDRLMEDVDLPLKEVQGMRIGSTSDFGDAESTETDSTLLSDIKEARNTLVELEASPAMAELDGGTPVVELPADTKAIELSHSASTTKKPYELQG